MTLARADFHSLSRLLDSAITNKAVHIDKRVMMSGIVRKITDRAKTSVILKPQVGIQRQIEDRLTELLRRNE